MTDTASRSLITRVDCEQDIGALRAMMKKDEFESPWDEGQSMSSDEAILYALNLIRN